MQVGGGDELPPEAPIMTPDPGPQLVGESAVQEVLRIAYRRILLELSSLPRAIAVMVGIAALSAIGTIIEQGKVTPKCVLFG